jgi:predicted aspartyl protease
MNRCSRKCLLLCLGLCLSVLSSAQSQNAEAANSGLKATGPNRLGSIKFELHRGYLIVLRGVCEQTKGLNFLLDTGTDPTIIDTRLADKLRLPQSEARVAALNQTVAAKSAVLSQIQVGPLRTKNLAVLVKDLGFLEKSLGVRIDAVIGLDALGLNSLTIHYKSKKIDFGDPEPMPFSVPLQSRQPFVTIPVTLNGEITRLLLDTGASSVMLFAKRIQGRISILKIEKVKISANLAGQFRRSEVLIRDVRLGEVPIGSNSAFIVDDQPDAGRDFDGLLGMPSLGISDAAFDFQHGTFGWRR